MKNRIKYTKDDLLYVSSLTNNLREATAVGMVLPMMDLNVQPMTDKRPWHFFDVYESLGLDRSMAYKLLEIGNRWCGSIWGWRTYLPHAKIYGLDIDPNTQHFQNGDPDIGVKVYLGDQTDVNLLKSINENAGGFNIIIDDGGHTMTQINTSFNTLWPLLEDGGVYIIEDLQCCYWPEFEGGLRKEYSSMEMIKSLFDNIHACYYKPECQKSKRAKHEIVNEDSNYLDKSVSSIHMYDSIAVIYKNVKSELRPSSLECNFHQEILTTQEVFKNSGMNSFLTESARGHYQTLIQKSLDRFKK